MKTKSTIKSVLCAAGFSALALMGTAQAQIINVDMTYSPGPVMNGTASGASVAPLTYTGTTWNDETGVSASGLLNSNNVATSVGFTLGGETSVSVNNGGTIPLLQQGAVAAGSNLTLDLTGLQGGQDYNLYFASSYSASGPFGGSFAITGQTTQATTGANPGSFQAGVDYVEFTNVVASGSGNSGYIDVTIAPVGGYAILNGFQIQSVAPVEAPEPTSLALLGLGALALLVVSRRRRTV